MQSMFTIDTYRIHKEIYIEDQVLCTFIKNLIITTEMVSVFMAVIEVRLIQHPLLSNKQMLGVLKNWTNLDKKFTGVLDIHSYLRFLYNLEFPLGVKEIGKSEAKEGLTNNFMNNDFKDYYAVLDTVARFNVGVFRHKGVFSVHFVDFASLVCASTVTSKLKQPTLSISELILKKVNTKWSRIFPNYQLVNDFKKQVQSLDMNFKKKNRFTNKKDPLITYDLMNYLRINRLVLKIKNYIKKNKFLKKQILVNSRSVRHQTQDIPQQSHLKELREADPRHKCPMHSKQAFKPFLRSEVEETSLGRCTCLQSFRDDSLPKTVLECAEDSQRYDSDSDSDKSCQARVVYVFPNYRSK